VRRILRSLSAALLAVLLATVLAPTFGWAASAGQSAHIHDAYESSDAPAAAPHDHHGDLPVTADSHGHHGCAGHVLGHLFVAPAEHAGIIVLESGTAVAIVRQSGFVTNPSRRLDRPPLDSELA
jgi:hypothetical protein